MVENASLGVRDISVRILSPREAALSPRERRAASMEELPRPKNVDVRGQRKARSASSPLTGFDVHVAERALIDPTKPVFSMKSMVRRVRRHSLDTLTAALPREIFTCQICFDNVLASERFLPHENHLCSHSFCKEVSGTRSTQAHPIENWESTERPSISHPETKLGTVVSGSQCIVGRYLPCACGGMCAG
jgi:hypothetical protein